MSTRIYFYPCECPILSAHPGPHSREQADMLLSQSADLIESGDFRKVRLSFVEGDFNLACKVDLSSDGLSISEIVNLAIKELDDTP